MANLVKVDKPLDSDRKHARNKSSSLNNLSMGIIDTGSDKWLTSVPVQNLYSMLQEILDEILENGTSESLKQSLIKTQIIESLMGLLKEIGNKIFTSLKNNHQNARQHHRNL